MQFSNEQEIFVQDWRRSQQLYTIKRIVAVWHSITVKQKIAKMFFKRKYLSAL